MACSKLFSLLLLAVGMVCCRQAKAQLEGKTLQTMLDQIAELQAYASVVADGYRAVEKGLQTITTIRQGEWNLHKTHYASLQTVNPAVRGMAEAEDIANVAALMAKAGRTSEASAMVADLTALLTDGQLSMTDGERMRQVIALDNRVRNSKTTAR